MEVVVNLHPLHLFVEKSKYGGLTRQVRISTGSSGRLIEEKIRENDWFGVFLLENTTKRHDFKKNFSVLFPTREE